MIQGIRESNWRACVQHVQQLFYSAGPLASVDRPSYVRAGSGLAWFGNRLVAVQDDANFLAIFDPDGCTVEALELPAGKDGQRQFDDIRGNKKWKLDLEACCSFRAPAGSEILLAFGSGSSPKRETIVVVETTEEWDPKIRLVDAHRFYARLREEKAFSGSELNIEGVSLSHGTLRLFQRGNGAPADGLLPVNATCHIAFNEFVTFLEAPNTASLPVLTHIQRYEIGLVDGIRLTFTDAAMWKERVFFLAAAEDSPDTIRDGPVVGVALGMFDDQGIPHWVLLEYPDGKPFLGKAEGLVFDRASDTAFVVIDTDSPQVPSQFCRVALSGFPGFRRP